MKKIKLIPFYLLSGLYAFAVFIIAVTYPDDMTSDSRFMLGRSVKQISKNPI